MKALIARSHAALDASELPEAVAHARQAHECALQRLGPDDPATLDAQAQWGHALHENGEVEQALPVARAAYQGKRRVLGEQDPATWQSQMSLAATLGQRMRLQEAEALLQALIQLQARTLPATDARRALPLTRMASVQLRQGRLSEALRSHRQADALFRQQPDAHRADAIIQRFNWVHALQMAGQSVEAADIGERNLADCVAMYSDSHEDCLIAMNNLAAVHETLGQRRRALELYDRGARLAPRALGERHPTALHIQMNARYQRALYGTPGDLGALRSLVERAKQERPNLQQLSLAWDHALATATAAHGRWPEAAALFARATEQRRRLMGERHPDALYSATGWAHALWQLGERERATGLLGDVVARIEETRESVGLQGAEGQREWASAWINPYLSRLQFLIEQGQLAQAFQAADEMKARQLMERHRSRAIDLEHVVDPATARSLNRLQEQLRDADAELAGAQTAQDKQALSTRREQLALSLKAATDQAKLHHPRLAALVDRRASLATDRQALRDGENYVSFTLLEGARVAILWTDASGQIQAHLTEPLHGLTDAVRALHSGSMQAGGARRTWRDDQGRPLSLQRWRDTAGRPRWRATHGAVCTEEQEADQAGFERSVPIRQQVGIARRTGAGAHRPGPDCAPASATPVTSAEGLNALARELSEVLIRPLQLQPAQRRHLLLAPDGALWALPWDHVLQAAGFADSAFTLAHNLATAAHLRRLARSPDAPTSLLALGDPAYGAASGPSRPLALQAAAGNGLDLRGMRTEDRLRGATTPHAGRLRSPSGHTAADRQWHRLPFTRVEVLRVAGLFPSTTTRTLLGEAATASSFKAMSASGELQRYSHVLMSVHGYLDPALPDGAGLVLAAEPDSDQAVDYLGARDLSLLSLDTQLAVLSACSSALGPYSAGEGLVGLSYALQLAGTRRSLLTLWPVQDRSAAQFVIEFMRRVRAGAGEAEALAATKRFFAAHTDRRLSDPSLWAAFVLHGS